jgi:hypothetical protein
MKNKKEKRRNGRCDHVQDEMFVFTAEQGAEAAIFWCLMIDLALAFHRICDTFNNGQLPR